MDWRYETDRWPVIKAMHYKRMSARRHIRLIVLHSMEAPEKGTTAEAVARYFSTTDRVASAHVCVDSDSIVQCVYDNDIAYAAPGANHDGIHIEMAGYARQTRKEWLDPYSMLVIENAADVAAQYCRKYTIPLTPLTDTLLRDGASGIVGHAQVSRVYRKSTHTDPGEEFPWDHFMARLKHHYAARAPHSVVV